MEDLSSGPKADLSALLRLRAEADPSGVAFSFLEDGEAVSGQLTYAELRDSVGAFAARARDMHGPGTRALLVYPQGLDFVVAVLGCQLAGWVPVPIAVPSRQRGASSLRAVISDCEARCLLTTEAQLRRLQSVLSAVVPSSVSCRATDSWRLGSPLTEAHCDPDAPALLQYTSGSTGRPRGVVVTQRNLAHNQAQMRARLRVGSGSLVASWLPMFHDMGLAHVFGPVHTGVPIALMPPAAFIQKPVRWLRLISRFRATHSGGPDFAFDHCVRRVTPADCEGLDLSTWKCAYSGAEPIRASTLERFALAFAPNHFRAESFTPVYGLAEATLMVSGSEPGAGYTVRRFSSAQLERGAAKADSGVGSRPLVGCGAPADDLRVLIVAPESRVPCKKAEIGEVWCSGPNVAAGYWGQGDSGRETFGARTRAGEGPFLRTGDLGFIDGAELFVTGRLKDLIIIRGSNHYPQDIEATVSACHPALEPGRCAAFSVDGSEGERLVVVQEVRRSATRELDAEEVFRSIRSAVSRGHSLQTAAIVLLGVARLPRTTSGKVQRKATRAAYLTGQLAALAEWGSVGDAPPDSERPPSSSEAPGARSAEELVEWLWRVGPGELSREPHVRRRLRPADEVLHRLSERGVLGLRVSSRHGGVGVGALETVRVLEQLSAHDLSLGLYVAYVDALGAGVLERFGSERLRRAILPELTAGRASIDFALAEPPGAGRQLGINAHAAELGDGRWLLSGTKQVLVGLESTSAVVVFVAHDSATLGAEGMPAVSAFLVSPDAGRLAPGTGELVLDGITVGAGELLGAVGEGLQVANQFLSALRLGASAVCVGGMKRCAQLARRYSPYYGRGFDSKLTPNPGTLSRLGSLAARVTTLECYVRRVAQALDAGSSVPPLAFSVGKIMGAEMLLNAVDDLMKLGATHWHAETERISQLYRDAGLLRGFDGSPEELAESAGSLLMTDRRSHTALVRALGMGGEGSALLAQVSRAVSSRVATLSGPLARRAQRWGNMRAGELGVWVLLIAALEGANQPEARPDHQRAALWARAQLRYGLAGVASGTPAETATTEIAEVSEALAAFARSVSGGEARAGGSRGSTSEASPHDELVAAPVEWKSRSEGDLRRWLVAWLARRVRIEESRVDSSRSFADYGLDSVAAVELSRSLSDKVGLPFDETLLWNFPTIDGLLEHLETVSTRPPPPLEQEAGGEPEPKARVEQGAEGLQRGQDEDFLAGAWEELEAELKRRT